jgi:hypothetical protein
MKLQQSITQNQEQAMNATALKTSMKNILRWMFFIPIALLLGALATFPLHWLIFISLEKGDFLYEYRDYIEYSIYPFAIGYVFVVSGVYLAPVNNNTNVAKGLTIFWILSVMICSFILNLKGFVFTTQSYISMPLGVLGTVIAYWIVTERGKNN